MELKLPKVFTHRNAGSRIILTFFAALIGVGTLLLMLPFASETGGASLLDALFTSTSAVCVTGLTVQDTATFWTPFGKTVILMLVQLGGLGVLTSVLFMSFLADRGKSVVRRNLIKDAISAPQIGGIFNLTRFILTATFAAELIGAIALLPAFTRAYGFIEGSAAAIFHSVSAFCNAGLDILGNQERFASLAAFGGDAGVLLTTTALVIVGGIGFLTWDDLRAHGLRIKRYRLQTKLVLLGTAVLLLVPFLYFFFIEFARLPFGRRLLTSWFSAVTPRTAGFATIDYGTMSDSGLLLTTVLMLFGGSSGSTAGGIKVTTLMVVIFSCACVLQRRKETVVFNRRIRNEVVRSAFAIFTIYVMLLFAGTIFLCSFEGLPLVGAMFECASALATVGLSTGITPTLSVLSKLMLIAFMYFGRVGGLTLAYAVSSEGASGVSKHAVERVSIG